MFRKELSRISKTLDCRFLENMHLGSFFKSNNALHELKYSPLNKENVWLIVSTVYSSSILSKIPRCCEIILQKYKHRQLTFFFTMKEAPIKICNSQHIKFYRAMQREIMHLMLRWLQFTKSENFSRYQADNIWFGHRLTDWLNNIWIERFTEICTLICFKSV